MAKPLVFVDAFGTLSAHFSNPQTQNSHPTLESLVKCIDLLDPFILDPLGVMSASCKSWCFIPALGARITILDREPHISYQGDGIMISYLILGIDHQLYNQYHS